MKKLLFAASAAGMLLALTACGSSDSGSVQDKVATTTPIKHLVVIYGENISFDHYFATYPTATNPAGEPKFTAAAGTPSVNGLSGACSPPTPTPPTWRMAPVPPTLSVWIGCRPPPPTRATTTRLNSRPPISAPRICS